jgi:hypothetical protein
MYQIYWHNHLLREYNDETIAKNAWEFFNCFLLKEKLKFCKRTKI